MGILDIFDPKMGILDIFDRKWEFWEILIQNKYFGYFFYPNMGIFRILIRMWEYQYLMKNGQKNNKIDNFSKFY